MNRVKFIVMSFLCGFYLCSSNNSEENNATTKELQKQEEIKKKPKPIRPYILRKRKLQETCQADWQIQECKQDFICYATKC